MAADFGYVNARVRGLRSRLLPDGFFGEQVAGEGFAALSGALAQSPYAREVEEARGEHGPLAAVDAALARNFVRVTQLLLDASSGAAHDLIALLLRRYDLANLKAIVRGLHAGRDADETMVAVLPAGSLGVGVLRAMAGAADAAAAGQILALAKHPLAEAFRKGAAGYAADGDLLRFEIALDRAFYAAWRADAARLPASAGFRRLATAELDAANLRTALKLRVDRSTLASSSSKAGTIFRPPPTRVSWRSPRASRCRGSPGCSLPSPGPSPRPRPRRGWWRCSTA
jgi:V/A-type H+/Na+-transporting ATPase subunit C